VHGAAPLDEAFEGEGDPILLARAGRVMRAGAFRSEENFDGDAVQPLRRYLDLYAVDSAASPRRAQRP